MSTLYLMKILSDFSLIFIILNYVFRIIGSINISGTVFIFLCLITYAVFFIRKKYGSKAVILLFLLPLIPAKTEMDAVFLLISSSYAAYLVIKGLKRMDYYGMIDGFKKGIGAIAGIFIISVLAGKLSIFENILVPYIIIYLVSTVILLRTLRYTEYNGADKALNKINLRYSIICLGLSFVLSMEYIRNSISSFLVHTYNVFLNTFLYLVSWIFFLIGYAVQIIIIFIKQMLKGKTMDQIPMEIYKSPVKDMEKIDGNSLQNMLMKNTVFSLLLQAAAIFLVIFIILKLFMRYSNGSRVEEEYVESKEIIEAERGYNPIKKILPAANIGKRNEFIRYYYQKFLKLCINKNIDIKSSDTTLQINEKYRRKFGTGAADEMRKIYIRARYNNETGDKKAINDFYNYYKKIKKNPKH